MWPNFEKPTTGVKMNEVTVSVSSVYEDQIFVNEMRRLIKLLMMPSV